ncbi:MAG: hypothetical protein FWD63_00885 [Propionibacteriaceae bacterium]|nr:hypothetical protein [Propionibacteriaceae bacterium]
MCDKCGMIRDTGHVWDGCVCSKCGSKSHDESAHDWEFLERASRDSTPFDAWYGGHFVSVTPVRSEDTFLCRKCGMKKVEWNERDDMGGVLSGVELD